MEKSRFCKNPNVTAIIQSSLHRCYVFPDCYRLFLGTMILAGEKVTDGVKKN